jgi:hypothetical protein
VGQALMKDLLVPELKIVDLKSRIDHADVLLVFGVGGGEIYHSLSSWLKKGEGRFLIFIEEREEVFLKAKGHSLAKDSQVHLFCFKKGDEEIFQQIAWEFVFLRFAYAVLDAGSSEAAREFFLQMEHYHRGVDLLASDCEDGGLKVLTNAMKNLSALPFSKLGQSLEGKCAGMPAIVCGAGPSLNSAIPLLSALKDRAIIIAGGSSVLALNAQGIAPHIFASIDPQPPYRRFLEQESFEVPFFYQSRFCRDLLQRVHGPLLWMPDGGSYPIEAWLAAECGIFAERFDAGWTVSNFCTSIAAHLGCSTVIFVGMDFSCGPKEIYASKISGDENRDSLIELEKDKLYSKRDWLMSAEWTVTFARKNPEIQWINASTGGIDLLGIEHKPLSEVAEALLLEQWDVEGMVHSLVSGAQATNVTFEKVSNVRKMVKESFEKSLSLCDALLKVWEKHFPHSPLEKGEYAVLDHELEQEICNRHFLTPLWSVWKRPILRTSPHPLGQHLHRLLFLKKALEMHLPHLRSFS